MLHSHLDFTLTNLLEQGQNLIETTSLTKLIDNSANELDTAKLGISVFCILLDFVRLKL